MKKITPRLNLDKFASYLTLCEGKVNKTVEIYNNVYVDYDINGNILGIEFLEKLEINQDIINEKNS